MSSMAFELKLLGRSAVLRDGQEIPVTAFNGRLPRRLLRVLAVRRGSFAAKEVLVEALWPDRAPADPAANLEVLVSRLRRALGHPDLVQTGSGGYTLVDDPRVEVDLEDLLAAGDHVRSGDPEPLTVLAEARRAASRWMGEPLAEDAYEEWAFEPRAQAARALQDVLEAGSSAALLLGDAAEAVALAEQAVVREPLREAAALHLVRALAGAGDVAGALTAFERFRSRFADELGLDPSGEATELHARVLRGEIEVRGAGRGPARAKEVGVSAGNARFVGRETELATLIGADPVVVIQGPSGAGKTRLIDELTGGSPIPVLRARAVPAERDEPWALVRSVLREVLALDAFAVHAVPELVAVAMRDLLPELADLRDVADLELDPASRHGLWLEGVGRLLSAVLPAVLVVDDLQWADPSSLELLSPTAQRADGLRLVLSCRPDEIRRDSRAEVFLEELERSRDVRHLELVPLSGQALGSLVDDDAIAYAIAEESDAWPLTVVEVLRALEADGIVRADGQGRWWVQGTPGIDAVQDAVRLGNRRAIQARIRRLDPGTRDALEVLAVLGREVPERTVAQVTGSEASQSLDGLDRLARAGLARWGEHGWTTAHESVAAAAVAELDPSASARLHEAVATVLVLEGADPSELALHLAIAGHAAEAATRYADAAEEALNRSANDEVTALAGSGLELDPREPNRSRLLRARAEARSRAGDLAGAREDLRAALVAPQDRVSRSRLLARVAMMEGGSDDYGRAADLVEMALSEAGDDPAARAEALAVGSIVDMNLGRQERAEERADEALELFEALGDASGAAGILDGRAMATFMRGRIREAVDLFDRVARLFEDAGELLRVGTPRSTRGHALVFMARPDEGLVDAEAALALERSLGHAEGEAYALWHRSEALSGLGRADEALASASEALRIAEGIGHREWTSASWRAVGIALQAAGRYDDAVDAFTRSLEMGGSIPLFAAWARARMAIGLVGAGRAEEAPPLVEASLAGGDGLTRYEARWADAEVRAALGDPDAAEIARAAAAVVDEGGYLAALTRLRELAGDGYAPGT